MPVLASGYFKPRPLWEAGQARPATRNHVACALPGPLLRQGYAIGSRAKRKGYIRKFYVERAHARISPYFPTPALAARWLTNKIAA